MSIVQQILRTQATIRALKGKRPPKRLKKPPRPASTLNAERTYRKRLTEAREPVFKAVNDLLLPELGRIEREAVIRADGLFHVDIEPWAEFVRRIMGDVRSVLGRQITEYERLAMEAFSETNKRNLRSLREQFKAVLGVDVFVNEPELVQVAQSFIEENASLIQGADAEFLKQVEGEVYRGFRGGRRASAISERLQQLSGISKSRADLIAIDQIQKINGQLTRNRQLKLGVSKYRWRTVLDERVRKEHRRREGRVFSWDDPPADGHPGEPIRCRCFAEPYLDDLLSTAPTPPRPRLPR